MGNNPSSGNRFVQPGSRKSVGGFRNHDFKSFDSIGEEAREEETEPLSMSKSKPQDYGPNNGTSVEGWDHSKARSEYAAPDGPSIADEENRLQSENGSATSGSRPVGPRRKVSIDTATMAAKTAPTDIAPSRFPGTTDNPDSSQNPEMRKRALTLGAQDQVRKGANPLIPTVFKWCVPSYMFEPKSVWISGSFNTWELVLMHGSKTHWVIIIDLPEGEHQYKFKVDDKWFHNHKEPTVPDSMGGFNNVIAVRKSDFEVFEALDMDCKDVNAKRVHRGFSDTDFGQVIPNYSHEFASGRRSNPPILPPQLLQVMLNKDTPLSCEPTLLPLPNHVMLNHMYALSIRDRVMVMSTTQRYRKKYVTTVLYRPVE